MNKIVFNIILLSFLIGKKYAIAQTDSISNKGTIKVSKGKKELYIKASASFQMYLPPNYNYDSGYKAFAANAAKSISFIQAIEPQPVVFNFNEEFNYTSYFRNNPGLRVISIGGKTTDTVRIEIDVFTDGQHNYYHTKPLNTITTKTVSQVGNTSNKYIFSEAQMATMLVLQGINNWEPAYHFVTEKSKKKSKKAKKPKQKKEILNAMGVLTVVFSTTPLEEK